MYGRNGQSICLLSPFFCPSSKIAQPKYAKGASERARSASVYGTLGSCVAIVARFSADQAYLPLRICIPVCCSLKKVKKGVPAV